MKYRQPEYGKEYHYSVRSLKLALTRKQKSSNLNQPTTNCLLLTAYCLLPNDICLLPTAFCLLPTA